DCPPTAGGACPSRVSAPHHRGRTGRLKGDLGRDGRPRPRTPPLSPRQPASGPQAALPAVPAPADQLAPPRRGRSAGLPPSCRASGPSAPPRGNGFDPAEPVKFRPLGRTAGRRG